MNGLCATETTISSNNDAALSILNAFGNGTGRKTSENHRMNGANACAGKHSYGQFRHHGQVNTDPVSLFGTVLLQHIRSEEHTSELQSLMRISYAVFCLKKQNRQYTIEQS